MMVEPLLHGTNTKWGGMDPSQSKCDILTLADVTRCSRIFDRSETSGPDIGQWEK